MNIQTLQAILGFAFLIFVHELGHFWVAKWCGVRCTQFAIGFGQSMVTYRKGMGWRTGTTETEYAELAMKHVRSKQPKLASEKIKEVTKEELYAAADELGLGETEYRINWLPLGGYVKMLGQEDIDPHACSQDPRAFNKQKPWKRAAILVAGVAMNAVFGIILFGGAYLAGLKQAAPVIGNIDFNGPAANAKAITEGIEDSLLPGDIILSINGDKVYRFQDIQTSIALAGDKISTIVVEREGAKLTFEAQAVANENLENIRMLGVSPSYFLETSADVTLGSWVNVPAGSKITQINGQAVTANDFLKFQHAFEQSNGNPVNIQFSSPDSETLSFATEPQFVPSTDMDEKWLELKNLSTLGLQALPRITNVIAGTPAAEMGLLPGDTVYEVRSSNNTSILYPSINQLTTIIREVANTDSINLIVLRDGQEISLSPVKPQRVDTKLFGLVGGRYALGFTFTQANDMLIATDEISESSPLTAAGIQTGDRITHINGEEIAHYHQLLEILKHSTSPDITITRAPRLEENAAVTLDITMPDDLLAIYQGSTWTVPPEIMGLSLNEITFSVSNPITAVKMGTQESITAVRNTYLTLAALIKRDVNLGAMSGPLGIFDTAKSSAEKGLGFYLFFLGMLSINLAVFNLLPLPILDGGHLVLLAIEKIRGKPVSGHVLSIIMYTGLFLMLALFLFVTFKDGMRMFA